MPEKGGYFSERAEKFRLERVISFRSAYTQAAGNLSEKPDTAGDPGDGGGRRLNVLDVVTADRVVAQFSVEHPLTGYVPRVTFLGTRFENLQIAGHKIEPKLNLWALVGPKPGGDKLLSRGSQAFVAGLKSSIRGWQKRAMQYAASIAVNCLTPVRCERNGTITTEPVF